MTPREAYLASVRSGVPGWSPRRASLLREIGDGLDDAAAARIDCGAEPVDAERAAVAEFGPAVHVAAAIRAELAVESGRIAALVAGILAGVQMLAAELIWSGAARGVTNLSEGYGTLARAVDILALAALVAGVAVAIVLGRAAPFGRFTRRFDRVAAARVVAVAVLVVLAVQSAGGIALTALGPGLGAFVPAPVEMLHTAAAPAIQILLAVQCLRLASRRGDAVEQHGAHDAAERLPFPPA